jgi:hypothetical protein
MNVCPSALLKAIRLLHTRIRPGGSHSRASQKDFKAEEKSKLQQSITHDRLSMRL